MIVAHSSSSFKVFFVVLCTAHFFVHVSGRETEQIRHSVSSPARYLKMTVFKKEGMYMGKLYIGSEWSEVHGMLITSRNFNMFLCHPCNPCFQLVHPVDIFDPAHSTTYKKARCKENTYCKSLPGNHCDDDNNCKFRFAKAGKFMNATQSVDKLKFGATITRKATRAFIFGCIDAANGRINENATGIIGLSRHKLSLVNQLGVDIFSICLPEAEDRLGWVDFGGAVKDLSPDAITTPLVAGLKENLYYVQILSFTVGDGEPIVLHPAHNTFSVDTHEPMSYVDALTMRSLNDSIIAAVPYYPLVASIPRYHLCFDASSEPNNPRLPGIQVEFFEGGSISLLYSNIFLRQSGTNTWCFTFSADGENILGSQAYMGRTVVVNLLRNKISFDKYEICRRRQ